MPPEMLQDGISTEKTDVVGCLQMVRAIDILFFHLNNKYYTEHYKQYHSDNVINCDLSGIIYWLVWNAIIVSRKRFNFLTQKRSLKRLWL